MFSVFRHRRALPLAAIALAALLGGCVYPAYPGYGYYGGGYGGGYGGYYGAPYYSGGVVAFGGGWGWGDHDRGGWRGGDGDRGWRR
jgi:hypothetical protein